MPDWKNLVRQRLTPLGLTTAAETDLVDEVAQHLEDLFRELRSGGTGAEEAYRQAMAELDDLYPLRAGLKRNQRMPKHEPVPPASRRRAISWKTCGRTCATPCGPCGRARSSCCSWC